MINQTTDKGVILVSFALFRAFRTIRGGYTDLTIEILKKASSGNGKNLNKKVRCLVKRKMLYLTNGDVESIYADIRRCDEAKMTFINKVKAKNNISGFFVYVMKAGIHYKIGMSSSPYKRLKEVQTGNPHKVKIVKCYQFPTRSVMNTAESYFHSLYKRKRMKGEWFDLDDFDLSRMDEIIRLSSSGEILVSMGDL